MTFMETKDYLTMGVAWAGLLLGLYNAWRTYVKDTPKIGVEFFIYGGVQ